MDKDAYSILFAHLYFGMDNVLILFKLFLIIFEVIASNIFVELGLENIKSYRCLQVSDCVI